MAEQSAVNRFVDGSSPSVPVLVRKLQKTLRENMCHWFDSNHSDFWSVAQLVGQCKNLMRTVKETKTYVHAYSNIASWLFWVQFLNVFAITGDRM